MINYDKFIKEITLDNLRMLLCDVKLPIRCNFCVYKNNNVMGCGNNSWRHCSDGINTFLESEAINNETGKHYV